MTRLSYQETVGRFLGLFGESHDPVYYYLRVLLPGLFPFVFFLPWACYHRIKHILSNRLLRFLETWLLFVFIFFSACIAKKPQYILLLACPFALWFGIICRQASARLGASPDRWLAATLIGLLAVTALGASWAIGWIGHRMPDMLYGGAAAVIAAVLVVLMALVCAVRRQHGAAMVATGSIVLPLVAVFLLLGIEPFGRERSLKDFVVRNQELISRADTVYYHYLNFNSVIFYAGRAVERIEDLPMLLPKLQSGERVVCFLHRRGYKKMSSELAPFFTITQGKHVLVSNMNVQTVPVQ